MNSRRLKMLAFLIMAASVMAMGGKESKKQDAPAPISGVKGKVEIWKANRSMHRSSYLC